MAAETPSSAHPGFTIVVASKNPVKINAVHRGFKRMFPQAQFSIEGISVPSGVRDQPMTDAETLQGALNRVENAGQAMPEADYWVGLEGGVDSSEGLMQAFAWIVVKGPGDNTQRIGKARTVAYELPRELAEQVEQGIELGPAQDKVFGTTNSKQAGGTLGLLTDDTITRTEVYEHAVILALIPFRKPQLTFSS